MPRKMGALATPNTANLPPPSPVDALAGNGIPAPREQAPGVASPALGDNDLNRMVMGLGPESNAPPMDGSGLDDRLIIQPPAEPHRGAPGEEDQVISPGIMRRALDLGFQESDLDSLGSDQAVESMVRAFDRRIMAEAMQISQRMPVSRPQAAPIGWLPAQTSNTVPQQQEPSQPQRQIAPEFLYDFKLGADEEFSDPTLAKAFSGLAQHNAAHFNNVAAVLGQLVQTVQRQQELLGQNETDHFDRFIGSLPDEYHVEDMVGKGNEHELNRSSAAYKNRAEIFQTARMLADQYRAKNLPVPGRDMLFRAAVNYKFADQVDKLARRRVNGEVQKRMGQMSYRPTQRDGRPLTGWESAKEFGKRYAAERGIDYGTDAEQHLAEFAKV